MKLAAIQTDALREIINMGVGQAAGVLNAMLDSHVVLRVPMVEVLTVEELTRHSDAFNNTMLSAVRLGFKGPFAGNASLVFQTESAIKLVTLLTEEEADSPDLDTMMIGTLTEVGNIVLNGVMGAIGNELQTHISYSVPNYVDQPSEILQSARDTDASGSKIIWVQTRFTIEKHSIDGDIVLIFEVGSLDLLLNALGREYELNA